MIFEKPHTKILGLRLFVLEKHEDERGCFFESFNQEDIMNNIPHTLNVGGKKYPLRRRFVQDNQSINKRGVIRGMHLQREPHEQGKLVRVIKGKILDVVIDMRPESNTYQNKFYIELSEDNNRMLFVPPGCLHGFLSLEDNTIVNYKVNKYWNKESEWGVRWDDPSLLIDWKLSEYNIEQPIVSEKDKSLPCLNNQSIKEIITNQ